MKNWISVVAAILMLTGCADSHQLIRDANSQGVHLSTSDTVFISVPMDGIYGAHTYHGSGQDTAQIIYAAFEKHTDMVRLGLPSQDFKEAQVAAESSGYKYLIYPVILHWEDRATEWSGIPDKVEVKISVVDVATGQVLTTVIAKGKSGLATFGGDHPQDLLPEPIEKFVSSLY